MAPKTRSTRSKKRKAVDSPPPPDPIPYEDTTDRALVTGPVNALVVRRVNWAVPQKFPMSILFDAVNPLRLFKQGTVFNEKDDDPFPLYNPRDCQDATETDDEAILQPYRPESHRCVQWIGFVVLLSLINGTIVRPKYRFSCDLKVESFMNWTDGQVHEISYGKLRKIPEKKHLRWSGKIISIHVQYARLIQQFVFGDNHAKQNKGHEALRRRTYAQRILDQLGMELDQFQKEGGELVHFRSAVLNPVLQRQLRGVPDSYGPAIRKAIAPSNAIPTISQVTTFYLGLNPLATRCIPYYRRHLFYIREARWHLGILMGKISIKSTADFERSLRHHDTIMEALRESLRPTPDSIPLLNEVEAAAVTVKGTDEFFLHELSLTVSTRQGFISPHSNQVSL